MLSNLIDWISLIKVSPALLNYFSEQMNYSIDITRLGIQFMCKEGRELHLSLCLPIINLQIDAETELRINLGHFFGQNDEK